MSNIKPIGGTIQAFRIKVPSSNPKSASKVTAVAQSGDPLQQTQEKEEPVYHARRPHQKSRLGCKTCRQRRKKCDEGKPKCGFCTRRNVTCEYNAAQLIERPRPVPNPKVSPNTSLWPGPKAPPVLVNRGQFTNHDLYLLHHFIKTTAYGFGNDYAGNIYSNQVLDLALDHPHLMHAMIAMAACHMQHLNIDERAAIQYRLPEAFHVKLASEGLRANILSIHGQRDSDAVLTTAMLLNSLTYCAVDYRDTDYEASSLVSTRRNTPRWDWFRIQIGLTTLLEQTKPYHPDTIWSVIFQMSDFSEIFQTIPASQCILGSRLAQFCEIDESSNPDNNPYYEPIDLLSPLLAQEPTMRLFPLYLRVIGSITSTFIDLLENQDTKALLIFAHWLALMCTVDQWWCQRRTTRECRAICELLWQRFLLQGMDDELILELLGYPARACGYLLPQFDTGFQSILTGAGGNSLVWDVGQIGITSTGV